MAIVQLFASSHRLQVPPVIEMVEQAAQMPPGPSKKKPVWWQVAAVQRFSSLQAVQVPPSTTMLEQVGGGEVVGADDVDWSSAHMPPAWSKKKPSLQVAAVQRVSSHVLQVPMSPSGNLVAQLVPPSSELGSSWHWLFTTMQGGSHCSRGNDVQPTWLRLRRRAPARSYCGGGGRRRSASGEREGERAPRELRAAHY